MLVLTRLEYGSVLYKAAAKTHLQKLDTIHNAGIRLSLRAFCTSPIYTLLAEVCMPDLEVGTEARDERSQNWRKNPAK
jgi:hypothetical protein